MPQILAIDWDRQEARYVVAAARGAKVAIMSMASVPLIDIVEDGSEPHPDLGNSLRAALAGEKLRRPVTLVGVDRGSIELLQFSLPPAQDAELPEMVANQALRQAPSITEDSVLDFLPLTDDPAEPRQVMAVAMALEQLERIRATCAVAGLKPHRLLLRPYAAASLFSRTAQQAERECLLVNLVDDEVDLTVVVEGRVVFARTVRLPRPACDAKSNSRILAEISRTLTVALQSRPEESAVECVYLFGNPGEHRLLAEQIREEMSLTATIFDPFASVEIAEAMIPEDSGRFSALIGMVLDEAHGGSHALDFLHPRRQPKPPDRRRVFVGAAVLGALLIAGVGYITYQKFAAQDRDYQELTAELKPLDDMAKSVARQRQAIAAVRDWQETSILWLEELRELSLRLPSGRDALILQMSMNPGRAGGGGIDMQCLVRDQSTVVRLENSLRDQHHRVRIPGVQQRAREKDYTWGFSTSIAIDKRDKDQYTSHLPPKQPSHP